MKNFFRVLVTLALISSSMFFSALADEVKFEDNHCVAWKTKKTMFLFSEQEPVGLNCAISAKLEEVGSNYFIQLDVPIAKFDSGEPDRDKEVESILGAETQKNLVIQTASKTLETWKAIWKKGQTSEVLTLLISNKPQQVSAEIVKKKIGEREYLTGTVVTKYSLLGLEPPSVAGGIVASVDDYLELHFQMAVDKIIGFGVIID